MKLIQNLIILLLLVSLGSCQAQKVKEDPSKPYFCYIGVHTNTSGGGGVDTWVLNGYGVDTTTYDLTLEMIKDSSGVDNQAVRTAVRHLARSLKHQGYYFKEVKVGTVWDSARVNVLGDTVSMFRIRIGIDSLQNFDTIPPVITYQYQLQGGAVGEVALWNDFPYQDTVGASRACNAYHNETYVDTFANQITWK